MTRALQTMMLPILLVHLGLSSPCKGAESIDDYLTAHETKDPILHRAVTAVRTSLPQLVKDEWKSVAGVGLFVTDFKELPARLYPYRTPTCLAARTSQDRPVIICNEQYLLHIETPIRAFEEAGELFASEDKLVAFIRSAQKDTGLLQRLRSDKELAQRSDQSSEHIALHTTMALLFFVAHELGHLAEGTDLGNYDSPSPTTTDGALVRASVLRSCRHVDEFNKYGFGLPGLEEIIKPGTDPRKIEGDFKQEALQTYAETERRFRAEESADKLGIERIVHYLKQADASDKTDAVARQHILMETLFVIGLYDWYDSLIRFADSNCGLLKDSKELATCMMQGRAKYIAASNVFGDLHRFILLRTTLAMSAIVRAQSEKGGDQSIWADREKVDRKGPVALHEIWRSGDLQRFWLLRILMDTPTKFAYTACMTGWFLEMDKKRGSPQIFVMTFEPLEMAIRRMQDLP